MIYSQIHERNHRNLARMRPTLAEARERVAHLSTNLPVAVDPLAILTSENILATAKAPYIALCFRESQAWRIEEFSRAACDMFERSDVVVGISNARHAAECSAAVWYLMKLMNDSIEQGVAADLYDKLVRLQVGFKNNAEMPEAINVLTMLRKVDKKIPGFYRAYESLSEFAHPNWSGSAGVYSKRDETTLITHFARDIRETSYALDLGLDCLIGSLEIFEMCYNRVGDLLRAFTDSCEKEFHPKAI